MKETFKDVYIFDVQIYIEKSLREMKYGVKIQNKMLFSRVVGLTSTFPKTNGSAALAMLFASMAAFDPGFSG